jgi:hypothetical protein
VAFVLYSIRGDWLWHPLVLALLIISLVDRRLISLEKRILQIVGKVNSVFILTIFYFLFFTPFSFIYRALFRNPAFKKSSNRFIDKKDISPFNRPF